MPSLATACMSAALLSTQLCPMAVLGNLPACLSLTVNCLQLAGTAMLVLLNCIASLPSMSALQVAASAGMASRAVSRVAAVVFFGIIMCLSAGVMPCIARRVHETWCAEPHYVSPTHAGF